MFLLKLTLINRFDDSEVTATVGVSRDLLNDTAFKLTILFNVFLYGFLIQSGFSLCNLVTICVKIDLKH